MPSEDLTRQLCDIQHDVIHTVGAHDLVLTVVDHGGNEDDENHGNEKHIFKENNRWRGLKGRCFPGILGVKFSLKNLRDNTLLLAVNKVKEPGSILTSGDSEGLGRGNLPRVWEGL